MTTRFRYAPRAGTMVLVAFFFAACGLALGGEARTNDRGLILDGIEFSIQGATQFYWVLSALSCGFVLLALAGLAQRARGPRFIVFEDHAVSIPYRWSRRTRQIAYRDIKDLKIVRMSRQEYLHITVPSGKVSVAAIMLESNETLRKVSTELQRRVHSPTGAI